ncbi:putative Splicing regulatory glutamine/lysine-rich protein 1 [Babesia divergens]|uniref:Splicing regulatory glutamine/lysine-rich protein 1 n=1 Tax=Babesia divergens TaxID=32595 RepID=A0AAD9GHK8_BABDI|nr:putative Splicing regulatory glutamine/lysine-rich protein 1 [Babesia divergens]
MTLPNMNGSMFPPAPPPAQMGSMQAAMPSVVISKGPSAPTAPIGFSSNLVPGLMDTLMMPVTASLPVQESDPPPMVNVVYVGGLHSGTSSDFVINIMQVSLSCKVAVASYFVQKCGKLVNFKRHTDPSSGVLANFALCDFDSPRGPYYAMECLANLKFGEGDIKVSCNAKVRGLVDEWVADQLASLKQEHPDKSDEELRTLFKAPEAEMRQEFEQLIKYEMLAMSTEGTRVQSSLTMPRVEIPRVSPQKADVTRADSGSSAKGGNTMDDIQLYTSRDYSVHSKEAIRRSKFRSKQRSNDDAFRSEERSWLKEEESLLRKLHRIGTVRRSTRERLVNDDLTGFARSASTRERERERDFDLQDEKEEAAEISSSEVRCTIPLAPPVAPSAPIEPTKRALPTVFGSNADEDEPIFNRSHRPMIKLGVLDSEVWEQVPKTEDEVFAFSIDWDNLLSDDSLVAFLEPWMKKCILEYMGDDESVACEVMDFLNGRLLERPGPSEILSEVEQFLDEDSRGFVLELWRHLIFHQLKTCTTA